MTIEEAKHLIAQQNGKLFGVTFVTKDKRQRNMSCRLGVRKRVKGTHSFLHHQQDDLFGLMTVYDFNADRKANDNKGGFRRITLDTLTRLKVQNQEYWIKQ